MKTKTKILSTIFGVLLIVIVGGLFMMDTSLFKGDITYEGDLIYEGRVEFELNGEKHIMDNKFTDRSSDSGINNGIAWEFNDTCHSTGKCTFDCTTVYKETGKPQEVSVIHFTKVPCDETVIEKCICNIDVSIPNYINTGKQCIDLNNKIVNTSDLPSFEDCCICNSDTGKWNLNTCEWGRNINVPNANKCSAICGNGILGENEECDDGNKINDDGCLNTCKENVCGDTYVNIIQSEECDDGNEINDDECTNNCKEPKCGDRIIQKHLGEQCDDGNRSNEDSCLNSCKKPSEQDKECQNVINKFNAKINEIKAANKKMAPKVKDLENAYLSGKDIHTILTELNVHREEIYKLGVELMKMNFEYQNCIQKLDVSENLGMNIFQLKYFIPTVFAQQNGIYCEMCNLLTDEIYESYQLMLRIVKILEAMIQVEESQGNDVAPLIDELEIFTDGLREWEALMEESEKARQKCFKILQNGCVAAQSRPRPNDIIINLQAPQPPLLQAEPTEDITQPLEFRPPAQDGSTHNNDPRCLTCGVDAYKRSKDGYSEALEDILFHAEQVKRYVNEANFKDMADSLNVIDTRIKKFSSLSNAIQEESGVLECLRHQKDAILDNMCISTDPCTACDELVRFNDIALADITIIADAINLLNQSLESDFDSMSIRDQITNMIILLEVEMGAREAKIETLQIEVDSCEGQKPGYCV